jgi:hypothetical protein
VARFQGGGSNFERWHNKSYLHGLEGNTYQIMSRRSSLLYVFAHQKPCAYVIRLKFERKNFTVFIVCN